MNEVKSVHARVLMRMSMWTKRAGDVTGLVAIACAACLWLKKKKEPRKWLAKANKQTQQDECLLKRIFEKSQAREAHS
jgi:hypothetical protein